MKHLYLFILYAVLSLQYASAQDGTSVSVHLDGERLENLLTDEQKKTVRDLRITGRLQADDYAYLRNSLFEQLDTLNLRDADIDTIPVRAFYGYYRKDEMKVFLPMKLEHISDSAFCTFSINYTLVLSGKYPTLGHDVYTAEMEDISNGVDIELSDDNAYCKKVGDCIYSSDGTIAYYYNVFGHGPEHYYVIAEIMDGTKVIYGHALENRNGYLSILIPETVDSIGDRAFANRQFVIPITTRSDWNFARAGSIYCYAKVPPKLGKEVFYNKYFDNDWFCVFVPDESEEAYKAAEGWNEFDINPDFNPKQGINAPHRSGVTIEDNGTHYVVSSIDKKIEKISIYDVSGRLAYIKKVNDKFVQISKLTFSYPYSVIRINYSDGTKESIKIKP